MKRSIDNQLITQFSVIMIINNVISSTLFTWRGIFGPIYPKLAVFESFVTNIWGSSSFLLLTEMCVIKALLTFKWSWIVGVDEQFAGTFLILMNCGYILVSQSARLVPKSYLIASFLTRLSL